MPNINAQNGRIITLISQLLEMNNEDICEKISEILIESNSVIKLNSHENDNKILGLLEIIGDAKNLIEKYENEHKSPERKVELS